MSNATQGALDAVADAISEIVHQDCTEEKAKTLKTLADAAAQVHYGPQGWQGDTTYDYTSKQDSVQRVTEERSVDYHETKHNGDSREKPPAGFA